MPAPTLLADRLAVAAAVLLTGVLFVPTASDPVNVVKLSALVVCALVALALAAVRVVRSRVAVVPRSAVTWSALALLAAFVLSAVVAPHTATAVYGTNGRNSGLLAYGSALVLLLVALRVFDRPTTKTIAFAVLLSGLVNASYGLFQYAGIDAVGWNNPFNPIIATLGNPNFAAAYVSIAVPCGVWGALWTGWSPAWRILSAGSAGVCLAASVLSGSAQGPLAATGGVALVALAWLLDQRDAVRRPGLAVGAVAGALVLASLAAGVAGVGPLAATFSEISFQARQWYWQAAFRMLGGSPVWGIGLDSYGIRWRQEMPTDAAAQLGGDHYSDAAHSVPLQMLAQGGVVLGAAYLVLVLLVAAALVRGLVRLRGQDRLLLGGLGGSWAAYQVQSSVSIDQVPLLTLHLVLAAGVVVAAGGVRLQEVRLPGALPVAPPSAAATGRRRAVALPKQRTPTGLDHALTGVVVLVALALAFQALDPLRASRSAFLGDGAAQGGDGDTALERYDHAARLMPGLSLYRAKAGQLYNSAGRVEDAREAYLDAVERDPFDVAAVRTTGRLSDSLGDLEAARRWFERALRLDPMNKATITDLVTFEMRHSGAERAREVLTGAVQRLPHDADLWAGLGDARLVLDDLQGAREAYRTALDLVPEQPTALVRLPEVEQRLASS